jgi:hypothetical protein
VAAPTPSVQAILICDLVLKEAGSNKQSAIGIFTDVFTSKFPMMLNPLAVYVCLSDAIGVYDLSVELVDLAENKVMGRVQGMKLQSQDKLASHDFGIRFVNTVFGKPGKYEFRLLADGRLLGGKTLRIRDVPPQQAGAPGQQPPMPA